MRQIIRSWRPLHKAVLLYSFATFVVLLFTPFTANDMAVLFWPRLAVVAYLALMPVLQKRLGQWTDVADMAWALALLGFFYKETAILHQSFRTWDTLFVMADQWLTGTQPSLMFSATATNPLVADMFYLGYFSYYFMTLAVSVVLYLKCRERYPQLFFGIIASFLLYYTLFAMFKTVGPQFYFPAPNNSPPAGLFFAKAVALVQHIGEVPTGAFPSSHVGMTVVFLWISYKHFRPLFWTLLPFAALLFPATVYIKAHYLVDVVAGIISGPLMFYLSMRLWKLLSPPRPIHRDN